MISTKNEENAYHGRPLENMKLQDALLVAGVFAARDIGQSDSDVAGMVIEHARQHPRFQQIGKRLEMQVNHVINHMRTEKPQTSLSRAARTLTEEQRETAYKFAATLLEDVPDDNAEKQTAMEQLRLTLAIP